MRAVRSWIAGVLCLAAACSSEPTVIDVPFTEADQSAVVIVEAKRDIEAWAVDPSFREQSPVLRRLTDLSDSAVRTTVLFYERPLTQLGLKVGAQEILDSMDQGVPFPDSAERISQRVITAQNEGTWNTIDRLPPELSALRVAGGQDCATFSVEDLALGGEDMIYGGAVLDAESVMLVVSTTSISEPRFYRVTLDGTRRLPVNGSLAGFRAEHASGGRDAIYVSGTLDGAPAIAVRNSADVLAFVPPREEPTRALAFRAILAPPEDSDDSAQFYTVDERGNVERFITEPLSDPHWDTSAANPDVRAGPVTSISWNGPADVYFVALDGKNLIRYAREEYVLQDTDLLNELMGVTELSVLARIEGLGVFAGTNSGHLLALSGTRWEQFRRDAGTRAVSAIAAFRDGFLMGTNIGQVVQYSASAGFCETDMYIGEDRSITLILELDDFMLVAGTRQGGGDVFVSLLRPL
jgi:hypothetical protein